MMGEAKGQERSESTPPPGWCEGEITQSLTEMGSTSSSSVYSM